MAVDPVILEKKEGLLDLAVAVDALSGMDVVLFGLLL